MKAYRKCINNRHEVDRMMRMYRSGHRHGMIKTKRCVRSTTPVRLLLDFPLGFGDDDNDNDNDFY